MKCKNTSCKQYQREATCVSCKENYIVSEERYMGIRPANGAPVYGFLVKSKNTGEILGILNEKTCYQELAWVEEDFIEKC